MHLGSASKPPPTNEQSRLRNLALSRGGLTKPVSPTFARSRLRLWQAVKASIDAMPRDTAREQEHYARVRWLISLLYLMGLRISEVVNNPMGGFFRRRNRDGQDRWWLAITGKGDKERLLPGATVLSVQNLAVAARGAACSSVVFVQSAIVQIIDPYAFSWTKRQNLHGKYDDLKPACPFELTLHRMMTSTWAMRRILSVHPVSLYPVVPP